MLELVPPGRVIFLRPLKSAGERSGYDAVWVRPEDIIREVRHCSAHPFMLRDTPSRGFAGLRLASPVAQGVLHRSDLAAWAPAACRMHMEYDPCSMGHGEPAARLRGVCMLRTTQGMLVSPKMVEDHACGALQAALQVGRCAPCCAACTVCLALAGSLACMQTPAVKMLRVRCMSM